MFLLPEAVNDYVGADDPVRLNDAFVDKLALAAAGFVRGDAEATGRPGYAPADLLKLYIYGYLNRLRSSRRPEMETCRNIEVIWLLRRLKPDFKTIGEFRLDNRAAFRLVFREFALLCRCLDLHGRELLTPLEGSVHIDLSCNGWIKNALRLRQKRSHIGRPARQTAPSRFALKWIRSKFK
jgi:transposase